MPIGLPNGGESGSVSGRGLFDLVAQSGSAPPVPGWLSRSVCFVLDVRSYPDLSAQSGQGVEHAG